MEWNVANTQIRLSTTMGSKENNQMLKTIVLTAPLLAMGIATAAAADNTIKARIKDYHKTITTSVPYQDRQCFNVEVPVYETVTRRGDAAGGALAGMIIGGILGKGLTGKDDGAAAGAVMGGIIGADQGSKPKTEQRITGYRTERKCEQVTLYRDEVTTVYDYSEITWTENGTTYTFEFVK